MEVLSPLTPGPSSSTSALGDTTNTHAPPFDLDLFTSFLSQLLPLLIGPAQQHELDLMYSTSQFKQDAQKWASDSSQLSVYITKSRDAEDTGELAIALPVYEQPTDPLSESRAPKLHLLPELEPHLFAVASGHSHPDQACSRSRHSIPTIVSAALPQPLRSRLAGFPCLGAERFGGRRRRVGCPSPSGTRRGSRRIRGLAQVGALRSRARF